jgi:hypothetical protein
MVNFVFDRRLLQILMPVRTWGWLYNQDTKEWYKEKVTVATRKSAYLFT